LPRLALASRWYPRQFKSARRRIACTVAWIPRPQNSICRWPLARGGEFPAINALLELGASGEGICSRCLRRCLKALGQPAAVLDGRLRLGQREGEAVRGHHIVAPADAVLLDAENLLEVDEAERDKGGRRVGGRPAELVVEGGEEALPQVAVGGGHRGDAGEAEPVDEAILPGAVDALTAPAGRGRIAENVFDAQAGEGAADLVRRRRSGVPPATGVWTVQWARSVYRAMGKPWRARTARRAVMMATTLSPLSRSSAYEGVAEADTVLAAGEGVAVADVEALVAIAVEREQTLDVGRGGRLGEGTCRRRSNRPS